MTVKHLPVLLHSGDYISVSFRIIELHSDYFENRIKHVLGGRYAGVGEARVGCGFVCNPASYIAACEET